MKQNRRKFIKTAAGGALLALLDTKSLLAETGVAGSAGRLLPPPLLDSTRTGKYSVTAGMGSMNFMGKGISKTRGFNGSYLGPTILLKQGEVSASVMNEMPDIVTAHWHGLLVPGEVDGGPRQSVKKGGKLDLTMDIRQPPGTAWYHSHVHGKTAQHVYEGLAGMIQITDGADGDRGIPADYGTDDIPIILQDRRFDKNGVSRYSPVRPDIMHGFVGETFTVNGQVGKTAAVPKSVVRFRVLNGSNSRIYDLSLASGKEMHLVATDGGYLPAPITMDSLIISPGERAEILVDFTDGKADSLVTADIQNGGMGQMMGRRVGNLIDSVDRMFSSDLEILPIRVDSALKGKITKLPDSLDGEVPNLKNNKIDKERSFTLDMHMGGGRGMMGGDGGRGMGRQGGGMSMGMFGINGQSFDMERLNAEVKLGALEKWTVSSEMLMHPFHVHGVVFQVLSENGNAPEERNTGWKDTVLINGQAELLIKFGQVATKDFPFMFHCHILEHEDGGMMGQFTVT